MRKSKSNILNIQKNYLPIIFSYYYGETERNCLAQWYISAKRTEPKDQTKKRKPWWSGREIWEKSLQLSANNVVCTTDNQPTQQSDSDSVESYTVLCFILGQYTKSISVDQSIMILNILWIFANFGSWCKTLTPPLLGLLTMPQVTPSQKNQ